MAFQTPSGNITKKRSMTEEELSTAIEGYVESYLLVEYGKDGLKSAKQAYLDMGLEKEGVTFTGFILQSEEELAELVVEEFISHAQ
jgi:hypothetical protein